jgi:hypothetical protein
MIVILNASERDELNRQAAHTIDNGGYQRLLVTLGQRLNTSTLQISLSDQDLERIARYAFDYGNGGWENRLKGIFGRVLGPNLGR